jgi:hypothetical protein
MSRLPLGFNKPMLSPVSTVPFPSKPGALDPSALEPLTPTDPEDTARASYFADKPTPRPPREHDYDSDDESIDDMALRLSRELEDLALDFLPRSRPASRHSDSSLSDDDGGGLAYASSERSSVQSRSRAPSVASIAFGHGRTPSTSSQHDRTPLTSSRHGRTPSTSSQHDHTPLTSSRHGRTPSTSSQPAAPSVLGIRALSLDKSRATSKSQPVTPTSDSSSGRPFDGPAPPVPPLARPDSRASTTSAASGHRRTGSRGFGPTLGYPAGEPVPVPAPAPLGHARTASALRGQVDGAPPGAWGIVRAKTATGADGRTTTPREPEPRRMGTVSGAIGISEERGRKESTTRKVRKCVKDGTLIEDGRWVRVESGKGVLCEKCWKGMYLPKVRRARDFAAEVADGSRAVPAVRACDREACGVELGRAAEGQVPPRVLQLHDV